MAISNTPNLNKYYEIVPAYFLELADMNSATDNTDKFDALWADYLEPLIADYVQDV